MLYILSPTTRHVPYHPSGSESTTIASISSPLATFNRLAGSPDDTASVAEPRDDSLWRLDFGRASWTSLSNSALFARYDSLVMPQVQLEKEERCALGTL